MCQSQGYHGSCSAVAGGSAVGAGGDFFPEVEGQEPGLRGSKDIVEPGECHYRLKMLSSTNHWISE